MLLVYISLLGETVEPACWDDKFLEDGPDEGRSANGSTVANLLPGEHSGTHKGATFGDDQQLHAKLYRDKDVVLVVHVVKDVDLLNFSRVQHIEELKEHKRRKDDGVHLDLFSSFVLDPVNLGCIRDDLVLSRVKWITRVELNSKEFWPDVH